MNELEALLSLTTIPFLGSIKIRLLIQYYGSALEALRAPPSSLAELPGFGPKIIQAWQKELNKNQGEFLLTLAERQQINIIPYTSADYPKRLLEIIDPPVVLYVKGQLLKEDQRCLAIVGTRQASIYGLEMAEKLSDELTQAGFTIVSGLARGIDTAAHRSALKRGRTIGVLGSGLGHIYPQENKELAYKMTQQGALISEFPMDTPPDRQHFPQRNRIVSGMTMGTVLIEAPLHSGAMITTNRALSQGRKVFALPGRVDQENFQGNHQLIKNRQAELVENGLDILTHFDQLFSYHSHKIAPLIKERLEPEEEHLIQLLPPEELSIEDIAVKTKFSMIKLNVLLMSLVLKKMIKEYPGRIYKKI